MGEIKSAWEIALEKTKDIKVDKVAIRKKELFKKGRILGGQFLEKPESVQIKTELSGLKGNEKQAMIEGFSQSVLSNLHFPRTEEVEVEVLSRIQSALQDLTGQKEAIDSLFEQLKGLFNQYIQDKKNIFEQLKQQIAPKLHQKALAIAAQTGNTIEIPPESDPEFLKMLEENYKRMDAQYADYMDQIKDHINGMIGLNQSH